MYKNYLKKFNDPNKNTIEIIFLLRYTFINKINNCNIILII